ncbi:MAG: capsule biosynthesis protein CapK [Chromatiales bacterium 21-64-14]|nr:MAG: capsule biosynthesis protein CapK [Chromatiales bacterium 21-64-14]HQU16084.1 AMP-binding protein [Gammaproteobacteria bacterium]
MKEIPAALREALRNIRRASVTRALFPVHEWVKGHDTVRRRRSLERSQWWSPQVLEELRIERLRALLAHAADNVPYYRDLFRATGFSWDAVRSIDDLRDLPFCTKEIIRVNGTRLCSDVPGRLQRSNTGGSTGEPMVFYLGAERVSHDVAAKWRATRWWGVDIGDPEIVLWGSPIELAAQDRVRAIRDRLFNSRLLPAFRMSDADLSAYARIVNARRPRMLFGYPSALHRLASFAQGHGVVLSDAGIRVVFTTGERLYEEQRRLLGEVFGCPVANGYGGRDAGFIAHECPSGGMHLSAEDIIVEIIDGTGKSVAPGEAGEIVVTHLATRAYPFIRYRTGDIGTLHDAECPCGRGLPLLKDIQGRSTDFVVAADGTVMHGLALIYVIRELPGVRAFKIIQDTRNQVRVLIQPINGFAPESRERIVRGFQERLGPTVEVLVDLTSEIEGEKSGKFRYVVSHAPEARP